MATSRSRRWLRALDEWRKASTMPRWITIVASGVAILFVGGCFIVIAIDRATANSVSNDTDNIASCKEQGVLAGPLDIKPGQTRLVSVADCSVHTRDGIYVGCLRIVDFE